MGRHAARLNGWTYDDKTQAIHTPYGQTITLQSIAQRMADDIVCRHDFTGKWTGWKMRGDRLTPPHVGSKGPALKPDTATELARWINEAARTQNHHDKP